MRSLTGRLALTYFLVLFFALAAVDVLVLGAIEGLTVRQREVAAFTATNIAVNTVAPFYEAGQPAQDTIGDLALAVRNHAVQAGARVLAIDLSGRVVADSNRVASLVGRHLDQPEVASALSGRATSGRRWFDGVGWVLYTVSPVLQNKTPVGAVLMSSSLDDVYAALADIARTVVVMSAAALAVATLAGAGVARTITGPVLRLTRAVERMGRGDLGQRVRVRGRDEVATLGASFNDMAERLEREEERRRAFLADVAHELRTPISTIRALAEPLAGTGAGAPGDVAAEERSRVLDLETCRELAREMEGQTERLGRLVSDLLELARLESPRVTLQIEELDLTALVGGVAHSIQSLAEDEGVALEILPSKPVVIEADGLRLEQVFVNLLTNGARYSGRGSRVIAGVSERDQVAVVTVSDNGRGISPEDLKHVFDRFYRVDRSRSRTGGGTGLGLAITKRIIELHGGTISVESREGQGTTFEVRLPLKAPPEVTGGARAGVPEGRAEGRGIG